MVAADAVAPGTSIVLSFELSMMPAMQSSALIACNELHEKLGRPDIPEGWVLVLDSRWMGSCLLTVVQKMSMLPLLSPVNRMVSFPN
jgi:hypothetical protein